MWWTMLLLPTLAMADDGIDTAALMAQRDAYAGQAKALARRACKGEGKACRREVADAIERTLRDPDDVEAEDRLAEPLAAGKLPADFQAFLFESMFREAQWMAHDACLAEASRAIVAEAESLAAVLCADCAELPARIAWIGEEAMHDPDSAWNEVDAMAAFAEGSKQQAVVQRLRNHVEQVCVP